MLCLPSKLSSSQLLPSDGVLFLHPYYYCQSFKGPSPYVPTCLTRLFLILILFVCTLLESILMFPALLCEVAKFARPLSFGPAFILQFVLFVIPLLENNPLITKSPELVRPWKHACLIASRASFYCSSIGNHFMVSWENNSKERSVCHSAQKQRFQEA